MSAISRLLTLGLLAISAAALSGLIVRALIAAERMDALQYSLPFG